MNIGTAPTVLCQRQQNSPFMKQRRLLELTSVVQDYLHFPPKKSTRKKLPFIVNSRHPQEQLLSAGSLLTLPLFPILRLSEGICVKREEEMPGSLRRCRERQDGREIMACRNSKIRYLKSIITPPQRI